MNIELFAQENHFDKVDSTVILRGDIDVSSSNADISNVCLDKFFSFWKSGGVRYRRIWKEYYIYMNFRVSEFDLMAVRMKRNGRFRFSENTWLERPFESLHRCCKRCNEVILEEKNDTSGTV